MHAQSLKSYFLHRFQPFRDEFVHIITAKTYGNNLLDERSVVDRHRCNMAAKFGVFVDEKYSKLPTLYWLSQFMKNSISHVVLLNLF